MSLSKWFGVPGELGVGPTASGGFLLPAMGIGPSIGLEGSFTAQVTSECRFCVSAQVSFLFGVGVMGSVGVGPAVSYASNGLDGSSSGIGVGFAGGGVEGAPLGGTVAADLDLSNGAMFAGGTRIGPTIAIAGYGRVFVSCTGCADPLNGGWLERLLPMEVAEQRLNQCIVRGIIDYFTKSN